MARGPLSSMLRRCSRVSSLPTQAVRPGAEKGRALGVSRCELTLRQLARRGITIASCPRCRRLVFAGTCGPFDPPPVAEAGFWQEVGDEGLEALGYQSFAGDAPLSRELFRLGRGALHVCPFLPAAGPAS
jgi:hypothetical protein